MTEGQTAHAVQPVARWMPVAATFVTLMAMTVLAVGWSWLLLGLAAVALVTWPLVVADATEHRLPNRIVLPCYPVAIISVGLHTVVTGESPVVPIIVGAGAIVFFGLMHVLGGMGMGDVKLVGILSLLLGSFGLTPVIVGCAAAFLFGAIAGAWAMATQHRAATHRIPFGPFLLAGFWLGIVVPALPAGWGP